MTKRSALGKKNVMNRVDLGAMDLVDLGGNVSKDIGYFMVRNYGVNGLEVLDLREKE